MLSCSYESIILDVNYAYSDNKVHGANMGPIWGSVQSKPVVCGRRPALC